ncbi:MAG TPA: AAA family ATPase [Candidatus Methylomirabilis sp.]|nr:AAA family ATPase [Candidatus Methylomirabilis sp.]
MYLHHFGLAKRPFEVTPDPRFLFDGAVHREALAALTYGIQERRGFISLVGEVGTGKTTLLRTLLDRLDPSVQSVLLTHTTINPKELLQMILVDLEIPTARANRVEMLHRLQEFLLERGARGELTVLIIDEAQNLPAAVLEEVRLLTNLETAVTKLLQVILAGQPELERILVRPELRQLRQRIAVHARVGPLTLEETIQYVRHRLRVAGGSQQSLFTSLAIHAVWEVSGGVPRLINLVCDHCLVSAFASGERQIPLSLVREAAGDLGLTHFPSGGGQRPCSGFCVIPGSSERASPVWNRLGEVNEPNL